MFNLRCRPAITDLLVVLTAALWTLWIFILNPGIPAYHHDWSWPLISLRACDAIPAIGSTWLNEGLGHPNPFATGNPLAYGIAGMSCLMPPAISLRVFMLLVALTAGFGIIALCRSARIDSWACRLAAVFYLLSPPFFNEVSAGQIAFLCAFALLPWVANGFEALRHGQSLPKFIVAAIVVSLSFIQPQFVIFDTLVALAVWISSGFRIRLGAVLLSVIAVALILDLPSVVAAAGLERSFGYTVPSPATAFEYMQSAPPQAAFQLMGYIIRYAETAYGRAPLWMLPSFALVLVSFAGVAGLILNVKANLGRTALLLAVLGFLIITGIRGPISPLFLWGLANVPAFTLLREFYHAAPLMALAYAIGLAFLARSRGLFFVILVAVGAAFLPFAVAGHNLDLPFVEVPKGYNKLRADLAATPPARVLPMPYRMPISFAQGSFGYDELSFVDDQHPSASEYAPTPELDALASLAVDKNGQLARELLARYGVGSVFLRYALKSAPQLVLPKEARLRGRAAKVFGVRWLKGIPLDRKTCTAAGCAYLLTVKGATYSHLRSLPASWALQRESDTYVDGGCLGSPAVVPANASPYEGWISPDEWTWANRRWSGLTDLFAVTQVGGALRFRAPAVVRYVSERALRMCPRLGRCVSLPASGLPVTAEISSGSRLTAGGWAALACVPEAVPHPSGASILNVSGRMVEPTLYQAHARRPGQRPILVVLRQRFSKHWKISVPGAEHVRVDGFANGWLLSTLSRTTKVTVFFDRQSSFAIAEAISVALYCAGLILLLLTKMRLGLFP